MKRILLVDDEKYILDYYSAELEDEGYKVYTAGDGYRLMQKIQLLKPHVIVLDIKFEVHNGLDLLDRIRINYPDLPVILCTAYDTFKQEYKSLAADYYVVKSFDLTELKSSITKAIEADMCLESRRMEASEYGTPEESVH